MTRKTLSPQLLMAPLLAGVLAGGLALALPCFAIADESPDTQGGRFNFTKLGDGLVRLDSQTGAVALCSRKGTGLACEIAPEDRALFETEIARLRGENATLKKELLSHGLPLPSGAMAEADGAAPGSSYLRMPTDADIDRAARFAGRVWHRFIEAVDRAQKQVLNKS